MVHSLRTVLLKDQLGKNVSRMCLPLPFIKQVYDVSCLNIIELPKRMKMLNPYVMKTNCLNTKNDDNMF